MRGLPGRELPSLEALRALSLEVARMVNPDAAVVGVAVNTAGLDEAEARSYLGSVESRLWLPAVDPFRQGAGRLVDAIA